MIETTASDNVNDRMRIAGKQRKSWNIRTCRERWHTPAGTGDRNLEDRRPSAFFQCVSFKWSWTCQPLSVPQPGRMITGALAERTAGCGSLFSSGAFPHDFEIPLIAALQW